MVNTIIKSYKNGVEYGLTSTPGVVAVNGRMGHVSVNETIVSATAPIGVLEGTVWYDTTDDVLKTFDGTNWNTSGGGSVSNTKTFYLTGTTGQSNLDTAVEIYNRYASGKNPIVMYSNRAYVVDGYQSSNGVITLGFVSPASDYTSSVDGTNNVGNHFLFLESSDSGTTFSISDLSTNVNILLTGVDYPTPYEPQYDGSPATKKYVDEHIVEYTAGDGIEIINKDYTAMRGPCDEGYHIPTIEEWIDVKQILTDLEIDTSNGDCTKTYLYIPFSGQRGTDGVTYRQDVWGDYWACTASENVPYPSGRSIGVSSFAFETTGNWGVGSGLTIRPFKDVSINPISSGSTLKTGWIWLNHTGSNGFGIAYNSSVNLISLSSDGQNWITIADKNLGATTVYNSGDTLSQANCGNYYQRGNNYGFPWTGAITTDGNQVDVTGYGPGNYYSSDTFITGNNGAWFIGDNPNLWGGETGIVNNVIINTRNVKMFHISDNLDLTTAQEAYNWIKAGKCAIIEYGDSGYSYYGQYLLYEIMPSYVKFKRSYVLGLSNHTGNSKVGYEVLTFSKTGDTISAITASRDNIEVLRTDGYNNDSWTPTYDSHPATKKYVDNGDTKIASVAPSNPTEGMLWYDTTNDVLKSYDGINWNEVGGETYTAGEGISIGNISDYSAMRGPAPDGFHIPQKTEREAICDILTVTFGLASNGNMLKTYLYMPRPGNRYYTTSDVNGPGTEGYYWCCTAYDGGSSYVLNFNSASITYPQNGFARSYGYSLRCFKDVPVIPTASWNILYDGSSVATGAGVFQNSTSGLISVSGDGQNWITIMDKNLGATSTDTTSTDSYGYYYQWGNNYGFPTTGTVTTSSTQVDTTGYGPGNYYSDNTFVIGSRNRSSTQNNNLWGGVTGVVTLTNAITNTGILNDTTGTTTTVSAIRVGTEAEFALITPTSGVEYHVYPN